MNGNRGRVVGKSVSVEGKEGGRGEGGKKKSKSSNCHTGRRTPAAASNGKKRRKKERGEKKKKEETHHPLHFHECNSLHSPTQSLTSSLPDTGRVNIGGGGGGNL